MLKFQVRNLQPAEGLAGLPSWEAELVAGDVRVPVDRHCGSWATRTASGLRHLPYELASRLQAKVRPLEKAAAKAAAPEPAEPVAEGVAS